VEGRIVSVTLRRNPFGKYVISLLVETESYQKTDSAVDIDVGLKDFCYIVERYMELKVFLNIRKETRECTTFSFKTYKSGSNWNKISNLVIK